MIKIEIILKYYFLKDRLVTYTVVGSAKYGQLIAK